MITTLLSDRFAKNNPGAEILIIVYFTLSVAVAKKKTANFHIYFQETTEDTRHIQQCVFMVDPDNNHFGRQNLPTLIAV